MAVLISSILKWLGLINLFKNFRFKIRRFSPLLFGIRKMLEINWLGTGSHRFIALILVNRSNSSLTRSWSSFDSDNFGKVLGNWNGSLAKGILYPPIASKTTLSLVIDLQLSIKSDKRPARTSVSNVCEPWALRSCDALGALAALAPRATSAAAAARTAGGAPESAGARGLAAHRCGSAAFSSCAEMDGAVGPSSLN